MSKVKEYTPPGFIFALEPYCEGCSNFDPEMASPEIVSKSSASPYLYLDDGYSNDHYVTCTHRNYCEHIYRYLSRKGENK